MFNGDTTWRNWDFTHQSRWSQKVNKTSKCIQLSEQCYRKINLSKLLTSMSNGWWTVPSSRKNKSSETSQPHSDMPSRIDLSHWRRIMSISAKSPKRNSRNFSANMMKLWWRKKIKLNRLNRSKKKNNLQLDHLFYTYFVSLLYMIY